MTTQTEAERLADTLEQQFPLGTAQNYLDGEAAAELRRLVSFNQQLMDEVARLNKAVADEREACAKVCDDHATKDGFEGCYANACAESIRARGNT